MKKLLLLLLISLTSIGANAQVQQTWDYSHIAELRDQVVDANGNIYQATTAHSNTLDVDATLVIKHNKTGSEVWRRFLPGLNVATALTIDASGNVYVTGISSSVFFPSTPPQIGDHQQIYTAKLDANGIVAWTNAFTGDNVYGIPRSIVVNESGFPYVTGVLYTSLPDQEDQVGLEDSATADIVTIKYDAATGNRIWVKQYNGSTPGTGFDEGRAMAIDAIGHIYVSGTSQLNGFHDIVTIKYDPAGNETWVKRYSNPGQAYKYDYAGINGLKLDPVGNVIVAGGARANSSPAGGAEQGIRIIIKYTFSGFELWVRERNVSFFSSGPMITDNANNIIEAADGNTKKYNAAGELLWTYQQDFNDMAVDADNNIYTVGTCLRSDNNLCGDYYGFTTRKLSSAGSLLWEKTYTLFANGGVWINLDADKNVYTSGSERWSYSNAVSRYVTVRYSQCDIQCPANITVNAAPGTCGAVVTYPAATTAGACGSEITYSHASGSTFAVGTTTVTARSTETRAECSFTITVVDNQNPVITNCPSNKTVNTDPGVCYASANSVNAGQATATDNCSGLTVAGVRSDGLLLTDNYPAGITTITWTATDASNNSATCTQTITVVDNVPPVISNASVSKAVLTPPNHKMIDVTVDYTITDNCSFAVIVTVISDEPETGINNGDQGPDIVKVDDKHWQLRAERDGKGDGKVYTFTITATDISGNVSTATKTVMVAHNITSPHSGAAVRVGNIVNFSGAFWDVPGNKHTAQWIIDDKTIVKGIVTEPSEMKNGTVTGSYKFTASGVYKLKMNITDQKGITTSTTTNGDLEAIIVVYDPNGGYTYGGGYFASPAGTLKSDPSLTGDVSYGYTLNYYRNATLPKGEVQFEFKVGEFEFNALNFDYLVISNSMAQFKGTGKIIGGQSGIGFTMTVTDGQLDGSGADKIRMKIYNKNTKEIYYDNQPGASDAALPTQEVGANSTVVISGNNSSLTSASSNQKADIEIKALEASAALEVIAFPNPSKNNFTVKVNAKANERITMQVIDIQGRIIETKTLAANQTISFGQLYKPGAYYVKIIQGKKYKNIKLVKLPD